MLDRQPNGSVQQDIYHSFVLFNFGYSLNPTTLACTMTTPPNTAIPRSFERARHSPNVQFDSAAWVVWCRRLRISTLHCHATAQEAGRHCDGGYSFPHTWDS